MKKLPGSLEIKPHERLSKNDILNVLAEQMTMLEETFGVEEFKLYSFLECYIDSKKQSSLRPCRKRNCIFIEFR